jgi:ubiquinone/menaquinone biosynthesis C-methylase UbiE
MDCDGVAPYYHLLETLSFGRTLQNARCAFLPAVTAAQRAILVGDGDGRFLARLLQANRTVTVDFVDLSAGMIELAQRRVERMGPTFRDRVHFWHQDVTRFVPSTRNYDLVATHFFLDCFSEQEITQIVSCIASWAAPSAHWLVSDFREAPTRLGRMWTHPNIRSLYAAFCLTTGSRVSVLPNYPAALADSGWVVRGQRITLGGLLYSSIWQRAQ